MSKKTQGSSPEKKKLPNEYVKYSSVAIQMGVTIGLGAFAGQYLDDNYFQTETPWATIVLSLFAVFIALYRLYRDLIK